MRGLAAPSARLLTILPETRQAPRVVRPQNAAAALLRGSWDTGPRWVAPAAQALSGHALSGQLSAAIPAPAPEEHLAASQYS